MLHPPEKALTPAPCPAPPPLASEQLDFWIDDFDAQGRALPHYPGCACREHPSRVARLGLAATLEAAPSAGGADNELARACAGALAGAVGFRSNCRAVCVGADGLSATHTGSYGWSSAFGTQPANASSSMCWSIEVMARSDEENAIMVGVCRAEAASSGCVGGERLFATQEAWAINCADGALWGNGKIDANRAGRVPTAPWPWARGHRLRRNTVHRNVQPRRLRAAGQAEAVPRVRDQAHQDHHQCELLEG